MNNNRRMANFRFSVGEFRVILSSRCSIQVSECLKYVYRICCIYANDAYILGQYESLKCAPMPKKPHSNYLFKTFENHLLVYEKQKRKKLAVWCH